MRDIYQEVTDQIIAQIEAGALPWLQPWKNGKGSASGLPFNAASNRAYSGVNTLILMAARAQAGQPRHLHRRARRIGRGRLPRRVFPGNRQRRRGRRRARGGLT